MAQADKSGSKPSAADLAKQAKSLIPKSAKRGRKGRETPPEVMAQIVAVLLTGQFNTDTEVAAVTGISKATVSRIKRAIPRHLLEQLETVKSARIDGMIEDFIGESLKSLQRIARVTEDDGWLKTQNAAELATLYGVKADKVIKILEAIEYANEARLPSAVEGED